MYHGHLGFLLMKAHLSALLPRYLFLAQVVWMHEEYNSVLSTPTTADKTRCFDQCRYIGKTEISSNISTCGRYIGQSLKLIFFESWPLQGLEKQHVLRALLSTHESICSQKFVESIALNKFIYFDKVLKNYIEFMWHLFGCKGLLVDHVLSEIDLLICMFFHFATSPPCVPSIAPMLSAPTPKQCSHCEPVVAKLHRH